METSQHLNPSHPHHPSLPSSPTNHQLQAKIHHAEVESPSAKTIANRLFKEALCGNQYAQQKHPLDTIPANISLLENSTPSLTFPTDISTFWNNAIIVRTTGKSFQTTYLHDRLFSLWKLNKNPGFLHLGFCFYIVFNLLDEDKVRLLTSRWKIGLDPLVFALGPKFETWWRENEIYLLSLVLTSLAPHWIPLPENPHCNRQHSG